MKYANLLAAALFLTAGCATTPREPFHASRSDADLIAYATKCLAREYPDLDSSLFQPSVDRKDATAVVNFGRHWSETATPSEPSTRMMVEIISVLIDERGICHAQRSKQTVLEIPKERDNI